MENGWESSEKRAIAGLPSFRRRRVFPATGGRGWRTWGRLDPCLFRRVGAHGKSKIFSKNTSTSVTSSRSLWYIHIPNLSIVWEVITYCRLCAWNNVFIVVSHIGDTYPKDEHIQGHYRGYHPSTYQWVDSIFCIYLYTIDFSHKLNLNENMF